MEGWTRHESGSNDLAELHCLVQIAACKPRLWVRFKDGIPVHKRYYQRLYLFISWPFAWHVPFPLFLYMHLIHSYLYQTFSAVQIEITECHLCHTNTWRPTGPLRKHLFLKKKLSEFLRNEADETRAEGRGIRMGQVQNTLRNTRCPSGIHSLSAWVKWLDSL